MVNHDKLSFRSDVVAVAPPGYPAILDERQVAIWLGLNNRELKALVRAGHLLPLGRARARTQKRFAAVYILQVRGDLDWLSTARDIITSHWRKANAHKRKARLQKRPPPLPNQETLL
jgi:hypothetical protein